MITAQGLFYLTKNVFASAVVMNTGNADYVNICRSTNVLMYTFSIRAALTRNGEIYIWSVQSNCHSQSAILYANLCSQKIVDISCYNDHAAAVTDSGSVHFFGLNEAYGSQNSHISRAAAHHVPVEPLFHHSVQRVWILPVDQCSPFSCSCCIIGLTDKGALYVCPAPTNQQRWMHHAGAILIKGLEGKKLKNFK